jgi:hypothetical protein
MRVRSRRTGHEYVRLVMALGVRNLNAEQMPPTDDWYTASQRASRTLQVDDRGEVGDHSTKAFLSRSLGGRESRACITPEQQASCQKRMRLVSFRNSFK